MPLFSARLAASLISSILLFAPAAFAQAPTSSPPGIHVSVDRVNVGIIVTDSRGNFVSGLHREDFQLLDNGVAQPITDFLSIDEPAQVLLLVEAGPAVYFLQAGHLQTVSALLQGLSPADRVAIARYNQAAEPILNFTSDKYAATAALDQLHFNLGFGDLNLASSLLTALDWLVRIPGKKSLVLLSTGVDTSPPAAIQTLLIRLKTTDVRVLTVALGGELRTASPAEKKHAKKDQASQEKLQAGAEVWAQADQELKAIATANGGRAYFPQSNKDFAQIFSEIAQLLRNEYNLAFIPPLRDGQIHSIEVRIPSLALDSTSTASGSSKTISYRVDHRQAYLAPSPEHP
jgi:VWFA-related protein